MWAVILFAMAALPWPRTSSAPWWLQFIVNAGTIAGGVTLLQDKSK
jgi:hypothetical protein